MILFAALLTAATSTTAPEIGGHTLLPDLRAPPRIETVRTATATDVEGQSAEPDLRGPPQNDRAKAPNLTDEDPLVPRELRYAKYAALIDGAWSAAITVGWVLSSRTYDAPYPEGITGVALARVLYGTTWSILVATGIGIMRAVAGAEWEGLRYGELRNDWIFGFGIPGDCSSIRSKTCGMGIGGFSELSVRLKTQSFPVDLLMMGGWIQGHHDTDSERTLMESTWVQAPFILRARMPLRLGPVALETALGAGAYYGLHNAHVHPRGDRRLALDVPFWEMIILHGGAGPGLHAKLWLTFFDTVSIEADADLAWLALGGTNHGAPPVVLGLDPFAYDGPVTWRRFAVGIGLSREVLYPVRLALKVYGAQLSPGPVTELGHRALLFQFEVPFDLEEKEEDEGQ